MSNINRHTDNFPTDATAVLLRTNVGIVSAWFDKSANEWVCYDDKFTIQAGHSGIEAWAYYLDTP